MNSISLKYRKQNLFEIKKGLTDACSRPETDCVSAFVPSGIHIGFKYLWTICTKIVI